MVTVVADDLTGAAELAGDAFALGYSAEVQTQIDLSGTSDVVAVDTGTRSMPARRAARAVRQVAHAMLGFHPDWIYKKIDSLLRGNVLAEIRAMQEATGKQRVLLAPANPSKGRLIRGGTYWIGQVPLAETALAVDPEYPRFTSNVAELLDPTGEGGVSVIGRTGQPAEHGISLCDVVAGEDLQDRARELDTGTLPAGAADFFQALLEVRGIGSGDVVREMRVWRAAEPMPPSRRVEGGVLMVCGSASAWRAGRGREAQARGAEVCTMPSRLLAPRIHENPLDEWCDSIGQALAKRGLALVAIGREDPVDNLKPGDLVDRLAEVACRLFARHRLARLMVEGGGTAEAVAARLGWTRLPVTHRYADGVVGLAPHGPWGGELVVKVGSYPWPEEVWPSL